MSRQKIRSDQRKQTVYLPEQMLEEVLNESERQDRSISWLLQKAWEIARLQIKKAPTA